MPGTVDHRGGGCPFESRWPLWMADDAEIKPRLAVKEKIQVAVKKKKKKKGLMLKPK